MARRLEAASGSFSSTRAAKSSVEPRPEDSQGCLCPSSRRRRTRSSKMSIKASQKTLKAAFGTSSLTDGLTRAANFTIKRGRKTKQRCFWLFLVADCLRRATIYHQGGARRSSRLPLVDGRLTQSSKICHQAKPEDPTMPLGLTSPQQPVTAFHLLKHRLSPLKGYNRATISSLTTTARGPLWTQERPFP